MSSGPDTHPPDGPYASDGGAARMPLAVQRDTQSPLTKHMDELSIIPTDESDAYFITSPTTTFGYGDELLEVETINSASSDSSKWKTAFEDVRHFAGGLVSHPSESTKHYSILRHSHGLVYFKGFSTNVAISVFADRELPPDRQFWLQKKGYSGRTGLKVGASFMGTKSAWINVTPHVMATAEQLPQADERAWQRDIAKFLRKAPKQLRHHIPRETNILRVPCQADDGYFRVLLCCGEKGKKVLCPSPVFRLASTSMSSGSLRGASLSTMPIELGVKIGQFAARKAALNAIAPVASIVSGQVQQMLPYQPSSIVQTAASTAYDATVQPELKSANKHYQQSRQVIGEMDKPETYDDMDAPVFIGNESGPEQPFPIRFSAKVIQGSGASRANLGMPTANLANVPEGILLRLSGTYCGWALITNAAKNGVELPAELLEEWHQAVITVAPADETKAAVMLRKNVRVYLIQDLQGVEFFDAKLSVLVMGFLRPVHTKVLGEVEDLEAQMYTICKDIAVTQANLDRPAWGAEETLQRIETGKSKRSVKERYVDVRAAGQRQVDRVPVHKLGVRTESMGVRDRLVGNGGVYVLR